jgi:hypothetical protein
MWSRDVYDLVAGTTHALVSDGVCRGGHMKILQSRRWMERGLICAFSRAFVTAM